MNLFTLYKISIKKYAWLYIFVIIFPPLVLAIPVAIMYLEMKDMQRKEKYYTNKKDK